MHQVIREPCRWWSAEDIDPRGRYTLALVVLALLCASAAKSDSWGYFCETDGLLVYDLDHGSGPLLDKLCAGLRFAGTQIGHRDRHEWRDASYLSPTLQQYRGTEQEREQGEEHPPARLARLA